MVSFSKCVKKELCCINGKIKSCCGYSMIYGMLYTATADEDKLCLKVLNSDIGDFFITLCQQLSVKDTFKYSYEKNRIKILANFFRYNNLADIKKNIFKCGRCKEHFLRGLFLTIGTVNDPEKSYRIELVFESESKASEIFCFLNNLGLHALLTKRNNKTVLYFRRSEAIEDFFANIGSTSLAFDVMNSKINKELINNANRVTNCDAANINKALIASNKYNSVINYLIETEKIKRLPEHLQEMAFKRIEMKELSFAELGKQFSPPISKSGVHHRLEKILEFYNDLTGE